MKKQLLNKFEHIGSIDLNKVDKDLLQLKTIQEKLDYLKEVKVNYFDKFKAVLDELSPQEKIVYCELAKGNEGENKIYKKIFGDDELWTVLKIPGIIFNKYFKNSENDTNYTFWFLKYNANVVFYELINSSEFKNILKSNLKKDLLQVKLDEINEIEKMAKDMFSIKDFKFSNNYREGKGILWAFNTNIELIETLRVLDGNYYRENVTHKNSMKTSFDVQAYAKHILLKPYLEAELEKLKKTELNYSSNLSKEKLFSKQNNLIPKVSIEEVFIHFEKLTKETNKNNQFYLTNEQLLTFIESTFIKMKPLKQKFNCKGFVKKDIRKVFYNFYFSNIINENNHTRLKRKYFNIMNDAFEGFNENDYTDFAK